MIDRTSARWKYVEPALLLLALSMAFWTVEDHPTYLNDVPLPANMTLDSRSQVGDTVRFEQRRMIVAGASATTQANGRAKTDVIRAQQLIAMPMPGQANDSPTLAPNTLMQQATPESQGQDSRFVVGNRAQI